MILAWVISLLLLCSSLIVHLERLLAQQLLEIKAIELAQVHFMVAEKTILECETNIANLLNSSQSACFIQRLGKNLWKISSKTRPAIEVHLLVDENSGTVTRLNWRQSFE
ncbi:hypothetical protein DCO17_01375 [Polynucleobacter tropicus]|uniref:Type II secretion system protein GspI C-terminal domain-containing protein n=1 Tax=Polynucleobacter tropicus TaxID=1743174 RepID=A0A6M9Q1L6_9BURK|nr:hypothetical protein DCO17_01375 [Polynucleobacter tropicus]